SVSTRPPPRSTLFPYTTLFRSLLDQTILLFTSDHGCHFKTRNNEYKRSCHESSIRVPTMLRGGPFTGGGQLQQLVSLVDLPPTRSESTRLNSSHVKISYAVFCL